MRLLQEKIQIQSKTKNCQLPLSITEYVQIRSQAIDEKDAHQFIEEDIPIEWTVHLLEEEKRLQPFQTLTLDEIVSRVQPSLWNQLKFYQRDAIQSTLQRGGRIYLGEDMGLGKTWEALGLISFFWSFASRPSNRSGSSSAALSSAVISSSSSSSSSSVSSNSIGTQLFSFPSFCGIVVCPASMSSPWKRIIESTLGPLYHPTIYWIRSGDDFWSIPFQEIHDEHPSIFVISYELLKATQPMNDGKEKKQKDRLTIDRWILEKFHPSFLIADEAQAVRNETAQRSLAVIRLSDHIPYVILMSGTPACFPEGMWTSFRILWPQLYGKKFNQSATPHHPVEITSFAWRYCGPYLDTIRRRDGSKIHTWTFKGCERWQEFHLLFSSMCVRRTKQELSCQQWDEWIRWLQEHETFFPWSSEQCQYFLSFCRDPKKKRVKWDFSLSEDPSITNEYTEGLNRIREVRQSNIMLARQLFSQLYHKSAKDRWPMIEHAIDEMLSSGPMSPTHPNYLKEDGLLLWAHHHEFADSIEQHLQNTYHMKADVDYVRIDGRTGVKKRGEKVDLFQHDLSCRIAILSITACASGITLTRGTYAMVTELVYDPNFHIQAEDRVIRIGRSRDVLVTYCVAKGTTDEAIWRLLLQKLKHASLIIDGRLVPFDVVNVV